MPLISLPAEERHELLSKDPQDADRFVRPAFFALGAGSTITLCGPPTAPTIIVPAFAAKSSPFTQAKSTGHQQIL